MTGDAHRFGPYGQLCTRFINLSVIRVRSQLYISTPCTCRAWPLHACAWHTRARDDS
ncbi:hypothetical protein HMPREF9004_0589 [Schaalia cardiffensis F0333]|uniref:Uncharacterized protein n=1 Tax=Schaalia cardiffensis F0333 TaxID=888050 RepID=N6W7K9_9ACTO|nr:hypothetical protein HMPREF9004_0589 [Schaalia cardiffensis F0333]